MKRISNLCVCALEHVQAGMLGSLKQSTTHPPLLLFLRRGGL